MGFTFFAPQLNCSRTTTLKNEKTMNDDFEDLRKLIALKRFEQPPEGFVDDFLAEFQRRRSEQPPAKVSPIQRLWERLDAFFDSLSPPAWGVAGAAAMAVFAALTWMKDDQSGAVKGQGTLNPVGMEKPRNEQDFMAGPVIMTADEELPPNGKKAEDEKKAKTPEDPNPQGKAAENQQ